MRKTFADLIPAILALLGIIGLYLYVPGVFRVVALGLLFALLFAPVVTWLRARFHLPGTKSTALVYGLVALLSIGIVSIVVIVIFFNLSDLTLQLEQVRRHVEALSPRWYSRLNGEQLFVNLGQKLTFLTQRIGMLCIEAVEVIAIVVAGFVLSFYIIKDAKQMGGMVLSLFPFTWREYLRSAAGRAGIAWERFVSGQLFIAMIVGILETVGLLLLGAPYPFVFGLIGGLSNLIPYIGPFVGAVPAVIAVLFQGASLYRVLVTALIFIAVQQIDNWILTPRIMKGRLGLHPAVTILSVLIGAELFGFLGATLAVPVVGMIWSLRPKKVT